jgi:hypothetical protein
MEASFARSLDEGTRVTGEIRGGDGGLGLGLTQASEECIGDLAHLAERRRASVRLLDEDLSFNRHVRTEPDSSPS